MNVAVGAREVGRWRAHWHRLVERLLPWWDPEVERKRDERTEAIRQRSIAARIDAERTRVAYRSMGTRMRR